MIQLARLVKTQLKLILKNKISLLLIFIIPILVYNFAQLEIIGINMGNPTSLDIGVSNYESSEVANFLIDTLNKEHNVILIKNGQQVNGEFDTTIDFSDNLDECFVSKCNYDITIKSVNPNNYTEASYVKMQVDSIIGKLTYLVENNNLDKALQIYNDIHKDETKVNNLSNTIFDNILNLIIAFTMTSVIVLQTINSSINTIDNDKKLNTYNRYLVAPVKRGVLLLSYLLSTSLITNVQVLIFSTYVLVVESSVTQFLNFYLFLMLVSLCFTTFCFALYFHIKDKEAYSTTLTFVILINFFASGGFIPVGKSGFTFILSHFTFLKYTTDGFRELVMYGFNSNVMLNIVILLGFTTLLFTISVLKITKADAQN